MKTLAVRCLLIGCMMNGMVCYSAEANDASESIDPPMDENNVEFLKFLAQWTLTDGTWLAPEEVADLPIVDIEQQSEDH